MGQVDWKPVLEFVKVFLSWPPIVRLSIIVGARYFRTELRNLINRVALSVRHYRRCYPLRFTFPVHSICPWTNQKTRPGCGR